MDLALVIKQRLEELGLEQRDLARAAQVTESYISQLLTQKKMPPAPHRSDIYDKIGKRLKLPGSDLAKLADLQRKEQLKKQLGDPPGPLYKEVRQLILSKCIPEKEPQVRAIFQKEPFGELERLVTQKLLEVVKGVAKKELESEHWLRRVARLSHRSYVQMRVILLEFLEATIFNLSNENCIAFLEPLIESWDINLANFDMEITLNSRVVPGHLKKVEFAEKESVTPAADEPGLKQFLQDNVLSKDAMPEEIDFLRTLRFKKKRPTALYYYREIQNLRDPLHFRDR